MTTSPPAPPSSGPPMADGPGFAARSDVGLVRSGNEDRFLARPPLFAVADGMGGHQAGEVASGLTVDLIEETAARTAAPTADDVVDAILRSNVAIRREAMLRADLAGMGTTCTVVVIDAAVHVAHVGDSRAYLYREGELAQLTEDHSLVASMVREGIIDPADAVTDRRRNILTRALGAEDQVRVDVVTADRAPGDRILLCSDGLHGQVADASIASVLREAADPAGAADRLLGLANAAGGDDNVTVIVIDPDSIVAAGVPDNADVLVETDRVAIVGPSPTVKAVPGLPRRPSAARVVVFVLLVLVIVALAIASWLWFGSTAAA